MEKNVGTFDMLLRLVIAIGLGYIGFFENPVVSAGTSQTIIKFVAFLPLLTGLMRFCPLYKLIGLSTCACGEKK
ncbi:MAG: DUF2892 domain-containing protein [Desulfobulbaceae bacterium]|nr:DUF2892 domain-containing protein [Desulfobulbaceae bacterium]